MLVVPMCTCTTHVFWLCTKGWYGYMYGNTFTYITNTDLMLVKIILNRTWPFLELFWEMEEAGNTFCNLQSSESDI